MGQHTSKLFLFAGCAGFLGGLAGVGYSAWFYHHAGPEFRYPTGVCSMKFRKS